jgi:DNA invertase Pin-like site-specific DNA recombinase
MTTSTGSLRLLAPARKSRKGDSGENERYARQDGKYLDRAQRDGHTIVKTVHDTISSQSAPWDRPNLKAWMTDPKLMAQYDSLLVETDRLSRADDEGWHYIEHWCYEHGKKILTTEAVQFPPRDDSDRYQWLGLKRRARTYWEDVRDKHADTRKMVLANGAAIGRPPFGYVTAGEKLHKSFVMAPDTAPLAVEAFRRIAHGKTAASVARWLSEQTWQGVPFALPEWRVKRVIDMIRRDSYRPDDNGKCHRDGHEYDALPGMTSELWDQANAALDSNYVPRNKIAEEHESFSGVIYCGNCGSVLYRHQSQKNGKPVGQEKYTCSRGRVGACTEDKCGMPRLVASEVNEQLDTAMRGLVNVHEVIVLTSGGSHAKDIELARLNKALQAAVTAGDMIRVGTLAQEIKAVQDAPEAPLALREITGDSYAELWAQADHASKRDLLARGGLRMVADEVGVHVDLTSPSFQHD